MAYICNRKTPCSQCEHYKFDKKENQMACFAPKEMGKANVHPTGEYEGVYYVDFENLLSYTKKDDETERKTLKNISPWEMSDYEFDDVESQMNLENYRATLVEALKKRFPSF